MMILTSKIESPNEYAETLRKTLKLVEMKLNNDFLIHKNNPEMILAVHDKVLSNHCEFSLIIEESGFLKDERNVKDKGLVLYHLGTKFIR